MLILRKLIFHILFVKNKLFLKRVTLRGYNIIFAFPGSKISLGAGTINSSSVSNMLGLWQKNIIIARHGGKISIDDGFAISGSTIYSINAISIGSNVMIGANCKIVDNDFHSMNPELRKKGLDVGNTNSKPIIIGNDCFIGMNSIILKGTILGNNVVIGAGSVVCGKFPDNCIVAGNPAKVIKSNPLNENLSYNRNL